MNNNVINNYNLHDYNISVDNKRFHRQSNHIRK